MGSRGETRRKPLWAVLGGGTARIAVYASGINPDRPEMTVGSMRDRGHRAFKLKVGFGDELDCRNLCVVREAFGDDILLAADVNQAWDLGRGLRSAIASRATACIGSRNRCGRIGRGANGRH